MELIGFILASSRRAFYLAICAGIGSGLSMVGLLALTNNVLHNPEAISIATGGLFALLILAMAICRVNSNVLLAKLSTENVAKMRMTLCKSILQAPLAVLERQGNHKLLAALSEDINAIANGIWRMPYLCINLAIIIGSLVYMAWLSWWLFVLAVLFIGGGVAFYRIPESRALGYQVKSRGFSDQLYAGFKGICEGAKELKMHAKRREIYLNGPLKIATQGVRENTVAATRYYAYAESFGIFLFFMIIGGLLFILPQFTEISSATMVGYILVFLFIQGPMDIILFAIPDLARANVAFRKIQQLGLSLRDVKEPQTGGSQSNFAHHWQVLKLVQVTHSYYREQEDNRFQLGPIDMSFKKGELVFLIGGNGSGKTTFAKLLLGLYTPEQGHIEVDETKITDFNREVYRQMFSPVFADFYLFEGLLGFDDTEIDEMAQQYISTLQLDQKVSIENGRFSTTDLSQGQKKRLALLTAYLGNRDFYMFDEWAADQDPVFKHFFYTQILRDLKARGKTILVISHDDAYFDVADRYIRMESGKLMMSEQVPTAFVKLKDVPDEEYVIQRNSR